MEVMRACRLYVERSRANLTGRNVSVRSNEWIACMRYVELLSLKHAGTDGEQHGEHTGPTSSPLSNAKIEVRPHDSLQR